MSSAAATAAAFPREAGEGSSSESSGRAAGLAAATQKPSCKTLGQKHNWIEHHAYEHSNGKWVARCNVCTNLVYVPEPDLYVKDYDPEGDAEKESDYRHWQRTGDR